jgi:hypothetical protein
MAVNRHKWLINCQQFCPALRKTMTELNLLYQANYSAWAQHTAELLRTGRYTELDIEHLIAELTDMGNSERDELESRLVILLAHLLKWEYQYQTLSARWQEFKGDSWRSTIIEQRERIQKRLKKSPGLKSQLATIIAEAYADAIQLASKETRFPVSIFPAHCPYQIEQLIDEDYYPDALEHHAIKTNDL